MIDLRKIIEAERDVLMRKEVNHRHLGETVEAEQFKFAASILSDILNKTDITVAGKQPQGLKANIIEFYSEQGLWRHWETSLLPNALERNQKAYPNIKFRVKPK